MFLCMAPLLSYLHLCYLASRGTGAVHVTDENTGFQIRTDVAEGLADKGLIDMADIRVLHQQDDPDFPFLHSTRLAAPEWPLAGLRTTHRVRKPISGWCMNTPTHPHKPQAFMPRPPQYPRCRTV